MSNENQAARALNVNSVLSAYHSRLVDDQIETSSAIWANQIIDDSNIWRDSEAEFIGHRNLNDCFYRTCLQLAIECSRGMTRVNQLPNRENEIVSGMFKVFLEFRGHDSMFNHIELVSYNQPSFMVQLSDRVVAVMFCETFFDIDYNLAHFNFY